MPTIKVRKQANGVTRYTAIVRMRRGPRSFTGKARLSRIELQR